MTLVSVLYPSHPGSRFDMDYYLATHMPMVREKWGPHGLASDIIVRGLQVPGMGDPTYQVMAHLTFPSAAAFAAAARAHGRDIMGDIPNFTDVKPVLQVSEEVA